MSGISVKNLTKSFKDFKAVSDISFEVREKGVTGFLGPNGAGKTTAIRMIAGLSKPNEGIIEISGKKIEFGNSSTNKLFGYLPEQPAFYSWMNGYEYLDFIAQTFGIEGDKKKSKISEVLKLVDLLEAKKKRIGAYSNGMKQRLGIAQALINDPKVLIMDEPVSALDPIGRREVLNIINKLKADKSIFLSTHILSDVDKICDDVIIINKGKILAASSLSELKEKFAKLIIDVEFTDNPVSIIAKLKKEPWVSKLESDTVSAKIWITGEDIIKKNLPIKFFAKENIGVNTYGLRIPETEDLFLELLEEDEAPNINSNMRNFAKADSSVKEGK